MTEKTNKKLSEVIGLEFKRLKLDEFISFDTFNKCFPDFDNLPQPVQVVFGATHAVTYLRSIHLLKVTIAKLGTEQVELVLLKINDLSKYLTHYIYIPAHAYSLDIEMFNYVLYTPHPSSPSSPSRKMKNWIRFP